jgi:hypothetical protein
MDEHFDFLNEARVVFSELLIHVAFQHFRIFPESDVGEFLDTFLPPHDDILEILLGEQARLKKKKKNEATKSGRVKLCN